LQTGQGPIALSPRFDYTSLAAPVIQIGYHMYGATMGDMHVDLIEIFNTGTDGANSGTSFTSTSATFIAAHVGGTIRINGGANAGDYTIAAVVNSTTVTLATAPPSNLSAMSYDHILITVDATPAWTDNIDLWQERSLAIGPLLSGGGSVKQFAFTIRGIIGTSFTGDMAFDDISVIDGANDVGVSAIVNPASSSTLGGSETVTITVQNFGSNPQANFPVTMILNGGTPIIETFTATIAASSTAPFTFAAAVDLSAPGGYTLEVFTTLATDQVANNDGIVRTIFHSVPGPHSTDFETGPNGWTTYGTTSFAHGAPTGTVINSAASGSNAWVTNLSGAYNNGESGGVQSPALDFSSYTVEPWVFINVWWEIEFSWDGAVLQTSIDAGESWQNVGMFGDPNNWYTDNTIDGNPGGQLEGWTGSSLDTPPSGSNGWVLASHQLTGIAGQSVVLFRIACGTDTSVTYEGFGFDDVFIGTLADIEVERNSSVVPVSGTDSLGLVSTAGQQFTYTINNPGDMDTNLTGTPLVVVTPGTGSPSVSVSTQPAPTVAGGGNTTFVVDVTPGIGPFDFSVSIANDVAAKDPYTFTVSGDGFDPNMAAQADPSTGSGFAGPTNGPFTMSVDPGATLSSANIDLTDFETNDVTVTAVTLPSPAPTGITPPGLAGPTHPIVLSWTGTADASNPPGIYTWMVDFNDAVNGATVTIQVDITINDLPPTHSIANATGGNGSAGNPYTGQFSQGDTGAVSLDLSSATDPNTSQSVSLIAATPGGSNPSGGSGLAFNVGGGFLTVAPAGTLQVADRGTHTFDVEISDGTNSTFIAVEIEVVGVPPTITSTPVTSATPGKVYSYAAIATGVPAPTLSVTSTLPGWLTFNAGTGILSGTPTKSDQKTTVSVTITANNGVTPDAVQTFNIQVKSAPSSDSDDGGSCSSGGGSLPLLLIVALAAFSGAIVVRRRKA
jgi:hypothetical protein